jgi:hypothetical protein
MEVIHIIEKQRVKRIEKCSVSVWDGELKTKTQAH